MTHIPTGFVSRACDGTEYCIRPHEKGIRCVEKGLERKLARGALYRGLNECYSGALVDDSGQGDQSLHGSMLRMFHVCETAPLVVTLVSLTVPFL